MFRTSHGQHEGYDWVNNSNKNHSVKPAINPLLCLHHNNWNLNLFVLVARSNFNIFYGHFIFPRIFSDVFFFHPATGQLRIFSDVSFPSGHWPTISIHSSDQSIILSET